MIAVIDITGNNLSSLTNALARLEQAFILTHDPEQIKRASHVILPGVGTAAYAMQALREKALLEVLKNLKQPLLGICLGMQLLFEHSAEGEVECLGLIPGTVELLCPKPELPVPHMGWNNLQWCQPSVLQQGLTDKDYVYFVHSFAVKNPEFALARCEYSESFSAIVQKDQIYGMQFHPEKSAEVGLQLLQNFCNL